MEGENLITDDLRAWIGREMGTYTSEVVTHRDIRRFAQAAGYEHPLYTDPEYAKDSSYGGVVAPPMFFGILGDDPPEQELSPDGSSVPESVLPFPPELPRRMAGGNEFEFLLPVRPGDVITARRRVADIVQRQGRSGPLLLTTTETEYCNQRGELVARQHFTYVCR